MREEPSSPVSALTVIALELRNANAQGKAPATSALNAILSSLGEKEGMPSTAASAQDLSLKVKRLCASQKRLLAFLEERSRSSLAPAKIEGLTVHNHEPNHEQIDGSAEPR